MDIKIFLNLCILFFLIINRDFFFLYYVILF